MIERDFDVGGMTLVCDDCADFLDGDFNMDAFQAMIEFAKARGWTINKTEDGTWEHRCPVCKPTGVTAQRALLGL